MRGGWEGENKSRAPGRKFSCLFKNTEVVSLRQDGICQQNKATGVSLSLLHLLSPLTRFMRCFRERLRARLGSSNYSAVTGLTSLLSTSHFLQSHSDLVRPLNECWVNALSSGIWKGKKTWLSFQLLVLSQQLHLRSGQDRLWFCPESVAILWINNTTIQPVKSMWYLILIKEPQT